MANTPPDAPTAVIIDDDADVRRLIGEILASAGFRPVEVDNGLDGVDAVIRHQPAVTTLDVTMPGIDGYETARRIREGSDTYILLITSLTDEADALLGYGVGADDVITKPFRPRELRARVLAMLRRTHAGPAEPSPPASRVATDTGVIVPVQDGDFLRHDGLVLDRQRRTVAVDGKPVTLTRTEFDLLVILLESGRRVRSKADLVLELRDESYLDPSRVSDADARTIEAHVTNLRRKLGASAAQPRFIETVRGVGYRVLGSSVERSPSAPA
jgi:two-component system OmpR family response regulator